MRKPRPEYHVWRNMKKRCTDPRHDHFKYYGGRGIRVCQRWLVSFSNFILDLGPRPSPKHTIERLDNNGNYEPGNVKWATDEEQRRNRSDNSKITWNGETLTVTEWAHRLRIPVETIARRVRRGWSPEKVVTTPRGGGHATRGPATQKTREILSEAQKKRWKNSSEETKTKTIKAMQEARW